MDVVQAQNSDVETEPVQRLRHVVIGVGAGVFNMHRLALQRENVEVVGVSDINTVVGEQRADELGCSFYADYRLMLKETAPDIAVIITPHLFHAPIAIDCLRAGCHVLVEKPMAVHVAEADAMIQAAEETGRLLMVNFQHRYRPEVRAIRDLLQTRRLGRILHVDVTATWIRTARYYSMVSWRGTWAGEGGAVLMNQAPHNLDMLCFLMGLPQRVVAWTRTLLHNIEAEDTAQAMLEWPEGALGSLHISTAEAGLPERLEIVGTAGWVVLTRDALIYQRFEPDLQDHILHNPEPFSSPAMVSEALTLEPGTGDHLAVYRNLHAAILEGVPLVADGASARMSLELANAITYSSHTRSEVELPLDRHKYASLLAELTRN